MPIYPGATWRPIPEAAAEPRITATQIILHTAVATAESLFAYWSRPDVGLESHFYVGQRTVEQYVDTGRQADANYHANGRAISIETWDNRDPEHTPWTPWQLDQLVGIVAWACRIHGIPARICPAHDQPGIGWHSMWGAPSQWTPAAGKTCPGGPRIAQMPELLRRVKARLAGTPENEENDDMALSAEDKGWLIRVVSWLTTGRGNAVVNPTLPEWAFSDDAGTVTLNELVDDNDIDTAAIVTGVLAGLPAADIAAKLAEVLPTEQAAQVADELAARLAT